MGSVHQICLRWNNHQTNFPKVFDDLRRSKDLVDVTLCCEGRKLMAHKLVLSACSPYFQGLFTEVPCKHPVIFFRDVPFAELESIVNYMYKGEVSVARDNLDQFLKTAESLQVKGLIMEAEGDHVPAVKETVPVATKHIARKPIPEPQQPTTQHITKEATWSQSYTQQPKTPTTVHKEPSMPSSQATFTPTSVPVQTLHQPHTPQSLGGGSSSLQSPATQDDEDDDVIIEPEIKFEAMDQSVNESANASVTDSAKTGSHVDMDTDLYITGDDPSESFGHDDRLADEIDSLMSNINNQQGGMASMVDMGGLGPSTSHDPHSEVSVGRRTVGEIPRKNKQIPLELKIQIIEAIENCGSQTVVWQKFGIHQTTVSKIYRNRERIRRELINRRSRLKKFSFGFEDTN